jgi:3-dehydroquinate synthase
MQDIEVALEGRSYNVTVGHDILDSLGPRCAELGLGRQVALVTDRAVAAAHLEPVVASLRGAGFEVVEIVCEGGETRKNLETVEAVTGQLIEAEFDRGAWVIALGGGVVGDMAGFVAATFLRGLPYVQVPTTVVAQVDASVGGKTAVNHPLGKNLIGAFHQPRLVWCDTTALRTLPRGQLVSGLAEVVKHGVIRDPELFSFLEEHIEAVVGLELPPDQLDWLISRNVSIKAAVVSADEREGGLRAILNYGHTVGHAIETASEHRFNHGEAVMLGMVAAGHIARSKGLWSEDDCRRQDALLRRLGMPRGLADVDPARIVERTSADKKRVGGRLRFILPHRIGSVDIFDDVELDDVARAVAYVQETY